ncbi:ubiquitin-like domain-containing C-terminal domain phosphatase 1 [Brevipalpus obovatus]|uniref:ubiquitin-like domain-containing C-terminal domain phosphatase 1 n=1 Tax=Brevipalpus obovatus TaxID=246614 RepID=UPI003D9FADCA
MASGPSEENIKWLPITIKWNKREISLDEDCIQVQDTIAQLKEVIAHKTGVQPDKQKLLGLKFKGKQPDDSVQLSELNLKPGTKVMLIGTTEDVLQDLHASSLPDEHVINDLDVPEECEVPVSQRDEFLAKIDKKTREYKIHMFNQPRPGKKLLVLDIDYTLFDHRSTAEHISQLMRPYLHEFLTSAYEDYDIVIWSATSMKWIDVKMRELGIANNPNYKVLFYLDHLAMIDIYAPDYGLLRVKPLGVIWGKFPQYTSSNTIMFDDVRRNFLMNPQNGLRIEPFKEAYKNRHKDKELLYLSQYLKIIADYDDLSKLNHRLWTRMVPRQ